MSRNRTALPTHSHDATKSTNIINHDMNTTSSDRTFTHVNDKQKKRADGGKTHKHKHLEVAPVHTAMDTKDTKEAPFDAKTILPESKSLKSISKLLESMKKSESRTLTFECIDGSSRTFPAPADVNGPIASTSTHIEPPSITAAVSNLEPSATSRTGYMAFGIEAYRTRPLKNELCIRFVLRGQCSNANKCFRIHPYRKHLFRNQAIEQRKRLNDLMLTQAPCASPENAPVQAAEPIKETAPTNPVSPRPVIQVKSPESQLAITTETRQKRDSPIANCEKNRVFGVGLTDIHQQSPVRPDGAQVLPMKEQKQKHPRPKINERCRRWLWNECNLGYQCKFVHEDLEYDDPEPEKYVEGFSTTLHDHIKFKLRAGFDVDDIVTGFESPWIFMNNLPKYISDNLLMKLLLPFGEVLEIRRPLNLTSPLTIKVHFANPQDAYRAFTSLHGKTEFGCQLDVRMGLDLDNKGTHIKDSCVRIDWDAPHRTWYAGFDSQALAEQALRVMRNTPYNDFLPTGTLHTALPSVGVATVKMKFLPVDVDEQGLRIYGPVQGLMSERSSYHGYTVQDTIDGIRNMISRFRIKTIDFEVRSPPYKEAKMRAWAYFNTPADAKAAAEHIHCRKPQFTGYTRIYARHIKTITFRVSVVKFRRVASSIHSLAESIWKQNAGNSLSVVEKNTHFSLKLCGGDLKLLGRLKAEVEKVLNGEAVLLKDGKTAWDDFFRRSVGIVFLQDLERAHTGVSIETDPTRRKIRLFGTAEKRLNIREKILEKIQQLRLQKSCFIPLEGRLFAAFVNGELASLREKLGFEHIILDFEGHALRLRGDEKIFNAARDAVELVRKKYKIRRNRQVAVECPVCFDEVSSPVKMNCGHSWCRICFHNYLAAASEQKFFPLTCLGNEGKCTERISLYAAKEVLSAADFDATASAAFDTYVQTHPEEFHYCPTPDCPQVFRSAPEGIFLQCPSCLVRICPNCNADAHDGLTCTEFKDGDDLFKEWANQHDVKRCPGCNIAIEKDEGCNHMKCTVCQTHVCWVCMKTFPGGDGIYGHMRSEHGSFGLGPIL